MNEEQWYEIKQDISNLNISLGYAHLEFKRLFKNFVRLNKFMTEHWIKDAVKKPGALRKSLGVKKGAKIPEAKLKKAETLKGFKK